MPWKVSIWCDRKHNAKKSPHPLRPLALLDDFDAGASTTAVEDFRPNNACGAAIELLVAAAARVGVIIEAGMVERGKKGLKEAPEGARCGGFGETVVQGEGKWRRGRLGPLFLDRLNQPCFSSSPSLFLLQTFFEPLRYPLKRKTLGENSASRSSYFILVSSDHASRCSSSGPPGGVLP